MMEGPILIVDDDPLFRDSIGTALELHGFRTRLAADGREALQAIGAERPRLVLLDLSMPRLDGPGLLRELAERRIHLPVIIVTSSSNGEAIARKFGAAAYLQKPIAIPGLLGAISACCMGRRSDDASQGAA